MLEIPWGLKDILPDEFEKRIYLKNKIRKLFSLWGYRELTTPTFEYFSVLSIGVGKELKAQMIKFIDRDGHIMALRPEFTTAIGRIITTKFKTAYPPFRFFYLDNVFKYPREKGGDKREIFQTGVEFIGEKGIRADAEVIALLSTFLTNIGVKNYKIIVGSIPLFKALLEEFNVDDATFELLKHSLSIRDFVGFYNILDELPKEKRKRLRTIFSMVGDKDILDEIFSIVKNDKTQEALGELKALYNIMKYYGVEESLEFDFSFLRDIDYYTGIVFELFVEGVGYPFAGGGRYDNLLPKMGLDLPATGFALELGRLLDVLDDDSFPKRKPLSLVLAPFDYERYGIEFAQKKRSEGEVVCVKISNMDKDEAIGYALERGIEKIYIINGPSRIDIIDIKGD